MIARTYVSRYFLYFAVVLACVVFLALGTWQLYRLQWKLALIERVEKRVDAPVELAPQRDRWPLISVKDDEYRHVYVSGVFLFDRTTPVYATTQFGSGFWLLTPLRLDDGSFVYINRGFVSQLPTASNLKKDAQTNVLSIPKVGSQRVTVSGLLRLNEPGGNLLRRNDPAQQRWYSRDIQALASAHHLSPVAPYFIDKDADSNMRIQQFAQTAAQVVVPFETPVGGLTVVSFYNNHLVYAITWYALALLLGGSFIWIVRLRKK